MKTSSLLNKLLIIILATLLILTIIPIKSKAETVDGVISSAQSFVDKGKSSEKATMDSSKVKEASDVIYNALLGVGIVLVLGVGMVLGIRFMMASAEDKADVKQALIPYIVGSFVILGAFGIWKLVIVLGSNF